MLLSYFIFKAILDGVFHHLNGELSWEFKNVDYLRITYYYFMDTI